MFVIQYFNATIAHKPIALAATYRVLFIFIVTVANWTTPRFVIVVHGSSPSRLM
jgi:hypothetical protein